MRDQDTAAWEVRVVTVTHSDPATAPSPGRARYVLLVVVLLLSGAFVGNLMHSQFLGASWRESVQSCVTGMDQPPGSRSPEQVVAEAGQRLQCQAPAEHLRAMVALGGTVLLIVLGLVLMQLLPYRLFRRTAPVRLASPEWQRRAKESVRSMGGRTRPVVVWGLFTLREPFTVRYLRRTRIVLPPGVVNLPETQANAILRHEAAHVVAGDVSLVWLTRGVWWALPPVLLLPVVTSAVEGVLSDSKTVSRMLGQPFWVEYAARAGALLLLAALISLSVLRSREHEADLRSVHGLSATPLEALLSRQPDQPMSRWRRLTSIHPPFTARLTVLGSRDLITHARFIEGAAFGLLAAMTMQASGLVVIPGLVGTPLAASSPLVGALLAGILLAIGWGTALWRAVLSARSANHPAISRGALLGLPAGIALGLLMDLSRAGTTTSGPFGGWSMLVTTPLVVAGAGGLSVALASLWTTRRTTAHTARWEWLLIAAVNTVLFTGALWISQVTARWQTLSDSWLAAYVLGGMTGDWLIPAAVALIGVSTLAWWWSSRRLSLIAIGVLASAAAMAGRWLLPSTVDPANPGQLAQLDWWAAVAAGAGCLLAVLAVRGAAGLGQALAVAPFATILTTVVGLFRYNHPWGVMEIYLTRPCSLLALTLLAVALPAALLPTRDRPGPHWLSPLLAVVFTAAAMMLIMRTGDTLLW